MTELTQSRLMLAGFRLLRKEEAAGRYLIRYRDREIFEEYGNDRWRTLGSYDSREERDRMLSATLMSDAWSVEV